MFQSTVQTGFCVAQDSCLLLYLPSLCVAGPYVHYLEKIIDLAWHLIFHVCGVRDVV